MVGAPTTLSLYPEVAFPDDPGLANLPKLFDSEWIWRTYRCQFGRPGTNPDRIRIRQFAHSLGRVALVSYEMEWPVDAYIPSQHLAIRVERDKPIEMFRYPMDRRLPGLSQVAHPETAVELLNKHVLAMSARRAGVELIRYRPSSRAVPASQSRTGPILCSGHAAGCSHAVARRPRFDWALRLRSPSACGVLGRRRSCMVFGSTWQ